VEEGAGDEAAPPACRPQRLALAVGQPDQRHIVADGGQRRIVEFMPAQARPRFSQRSVGEQPRLAIAEMQLAPGKAGGMAEQPRHAMSDAAGILEALAQHHVTAALAMHRPRRGETRQP